MNRAERLARLLRVLAAIIAEPGLNPLQLADRGGVSERTLRRDLAQLRELGYDVAYVSGYEVQEKLNLEGRSRRLKAVEGKQVELLRAVAEAIGAGGLWTGEDTAPAPSPRPRRRRAAEPSGRDLASHALVLIPAGGEDADFF